MLNMLSVFKIEEGEISMMVMRGARDVIGYDRWRAELSSASPD